MIAASLLPVALLQGADLPPLPSDWSTLAPIPYAVAPEMAPPFDAFVAGEIAAGRCLMRRPADGHYVVRVDIATLVSADGVVRRTVPHAIDCPTVEQYAAGLVLSFARGNLAGHLGTSDIWYRATIVFDWRG